MGSQQSTPAVIKHATNHEQAYRYCSSFLTNKTNSYFLYPRWRATIENVRAEKWTLQSQHQTHQPDQHDQEMRKCLNLDIDKPLSPVTNLAIQGSINFR